MADALGPLFDQPPPAPSAPKPDQCAELARVLSALERHVMAFLRERIAMIPEKRLFHATTLLEFVNTRRAAEGKRPCAPDSPRRVMRELEAQGQCQVPLRDRALSLYEVIAVSEPPR